MNRKAHGSGFTLMEVIVTVLVLGTGLVVLTQGLTAAIRSSAAASRTSEATLAADEIFQRMEIGEIDFTTQGEGVLSDFGSTDGMEGEESSRSVFRWYANTSLWDGEDLYRVALTVTWDELGPESERSIEMVRLFYKPEDQEE